jgi:hypothetical protein
VIFESASWCCCRKGVCRPSIRRVTTRQKSIYRTERPGKFPVPLFFRCLRWAILLKSRSIGWFGRTQSWGLTPALRNPVAARDCADESVTPEGSWNHSTRTPKLEAPHSPPSLAAQAAGRSWTVSIVYSRCDRQRLVQPSMAPPTAPRTSEFGFNDAGRVRGCCRRRRSRRHRLD